MNLALELIRRGRMYQFWGNVRYDTAFTPDRCKLLAAGGMIAVTGGIEIASDRLLPKIMKGVTVPHIVKVLEAFASAGIVTHAYLIYGFPGETPQDSIDSLETLRQLMQRKLLMSGVYHEFGLTEHSPIGKKPELFGIRKKGPTFEGFANYTHFYQTVEGVPPSKRIMDVLTSAVREFGEGRALDIAVHKFFKPGEVPTPSVPADLVDQLVKLPHPSTKESPRLAWLGGEPRWARGLLSVSCPDGEIHSLPAPRWVRDNLDRCRPTNWSGTAPRLTDFAEQGWEQPFRTRGLVSV